MSKIHHIESRVSENGNAKAVITCSPVTKLEPTNGLKVTGVPKETTCGACQQLLYKRYRELTDGQPADQRGVAQAWWKHGG
jgi:hypothetical protein